jgi:hypothetical protein
VSFVVAIAFFPGRRAVAGRLHPLVEVSAPGRVDLGGEQLRIGALEIGERVNVTGLPVVNQRPRFHTRKFQPSLLLYLPQQLTRLISIHLAN